MQDNNQNTSVVADTLIELLEQKNYEEITMAEIAINSGFSRRTIYRMFKNKQEILTRRIAEMTCDFWTYLGTKLRQGKNIVESCFKFIGKNVSFFLTAFKNNILFNMHSILCEVIDKVVAYSPVQLSRHADENYKRCYVNYVAGGCWGLAQDWLSQTDRPTVEKMGEYYLQIAKDLDARISCYSSVKLGY